MNETICLNCSAETSQKFCANCGQKTDTHRITFKHFIFHDLLHGVWHIERGILFTIKEAILRPGKASLDYVSGKRIRYYNVFYLCLLVIAANILLVHFYHSFETHEVAAAPNALNDFIAKNLKFVLLSIVPIFAVSSFLVFKRMKMNFAEHCIISGMTLLGILLISLPFFFVKFLDLHVENDFPSYLKMVLFAMMCLFPVWSYRNATKIHYRLPLFSIKIILFYALVLLQFFIFTTVVVLTVANKSALEINI